MKLVSLQEKDGAVDKSVRGLHNAKRGDIVQIGAERKNGPEIKRIVRIEKVVKNDRLQDSEGNIFNRNGIVFRRKSYWLPRDKRIVSAKHVTQKQLDKEHDKRRRKYLSNYDWKVADELVVKQVLKTLRVSFQEMQGPKEYK